ncbi:MAG: ParB/RepB/Spo0J family partition protein [Geminicoccaceae bacterium]
MELRSVDPRTLAFNPANPRRSPANEAADRQMAESIRIVGILQPPIVKATQDGLEILFGERRARGAIAIGLEAIDVLVDDRNEADQAMAAIVENVVRAPLSPVDQWRAIDRLEQCAWTVDAIATTLGLTVRTISKLKLLAKIHPPMLEQLAKGDMPGERELRIIANAGLAEQAAIWKKHRPRKGETTVWWQIANALNKRRMLATDARFDDELAKELGLAWCEDLFAPADEDGRYTTDIEGFLAAQRAWITRNLPANGEVLEADQYGQVKLPPKAQRVWDKGRKTDLIGYWLNEQNGRVETIAFRMPEAAPKARSGKTGSSTPEPTRSTRPPITKKGIELIGAMRTAALHTALQESPLDDHALIGLLVLALAADNVSVMQHGHAEQSQCEGDRKTIAHGLTAGGAVTTDPAALRSAARSMLASVLSCQVDASNSGLAARYAGVVAEADQHLPTMATEEFLSCLSKPAITTAARENGLAPGDRAKDTRASMIRTFDQRTYVHPAARFGLTDEELAAAAERTRRTAWAEEEPSDGSDADETLDGPGEETEADDLEPITDAA